MAVLSVVTIIASTAAFYIIYALAERWRIVAPLPANLEDTTGLDVGITLGVCVLGLLLALAVAAWLARRIVRPLAAVGEAARRIAEGDLATRVGNVTEAQGETAALIADFNAMADRLQRMADDVSVWNAQIAHELRTPLTILQGRLQGVKDGLFPSTPRWSTGCWRRSPVSPAWSRICAASALRTAGILNSISARSTWPPNS
ncbi:hypothetical protein ASE59_17845 [Sphingomonas sp. Leaf10]|nr:hypothetical protein ASE59_17845 [Sphingomonas sp. Leaf10]